MPEKSRKSISTSSKDACAPRARRRRRRRSARGTDAAGHHDQPGGRRRRLGRLGSSGAYAESGERSSGRLGSSGAHAESGERSLWPPAAASTSPPLVLDRARAEAPVGAATAPSGAVEGFDLSGERSAALSAAVEEARPRTRRRRSWYFATAGLAAIGLALLAGAATLKIGAPSLQKTPPFIAAAEGAEQGPAAERRGRAVERRFGGVADEGSATRGAGQGRHHRRAAGRSRRAQTPTPAPRRRRLRPRGSPVAPAADTPIVAPAAPSATVAPLFPDAKPVKTVSVRPDGTLISVDSTPAPTPSPPAPSRRGGAARGRQCAGGDGGGPATAAGEAATPKLDLPTKLSPKSSARVVAKTDTTAPAAATDTTPNAPLQLAAPAGATKAAKTPPAKAGRRRRRRSAAGRCDARRPRRRAPTRRRRRTQRRGRRRLGGATRRAALRGRRAERDFAA